MSDNTSNTIIVVVIFAFLFGVIVQIRGCRIDNRLIDEGHHDKVRATVEKSNER